MFKAALPALAYAMLIAGSATGTPAEPQPAIALTIDDLPLHQPIPPGQTPLSVAHAVIDALRDAHVPAYGFVNARWVAEQPTTIRVLEDWRAAGLPLGNHTLTHRHLSEMTVDQFDQEVARDEPVLKQVSGNSDWHWFRYPFLDEGESAAKRQAARQALARRGYRVAAVTMDFSDWAWTAPYARCEAANNAPAIAGLEQMYLAAAKEAASYYRGLSHQLYGRDIPYVVLLHDSAFEARMLPRLIAFYRSAGFRFVALPEAESDPAYADQLRPNLPAAPMGLENKAVARGIKLRSRTDYSAELGAICPGGPTAPTP